MFILVVVIFLVVIFIIGYNYDHYKEMKQNREWEKQNKKLQKQTYEAPKPEIPQEDIVEEVKKLD